MEQIFLLVRITNNFTNKKQRFGAVFYLTDVPILTPTVGLTFIELHADRSRHEINIRPITFIEISKF